MTVDEFNALVAKKYSSGFGEKRTAHAHLAELEGRTVVVWTGPGDMPQSLLDELGGAQ